MVRSHSRSTFRFDHFMPRRESKYLNTTQRQRRIMKKLQVRKQRAYDKQVASDQGTP